MVAQLEAALSAHCDARHAVVSPGVGQGSHFTWEAVVDGQLLFVRVENGAEFDDHLEVESAILDRVRATEVPTPRVVGCDASRSRVPFAWQALDGLRGEKGVDDL